MLVRDFLETSAERLPNKVALICGSQRFTYAELEIQANRLAQALLAHGIERGDRVVIHLPNCQAAVVAIFGALKSGAVFVPVNASAKPEKLRYILDNCRAAALISELAEVEMPSTRWLKVVVRCRSCGPKRGRMQPGRVGSPHPDPLPEERERDSDIKSGTAALLDFDCVQREGVSRRPERTNEPDDLACLIYTSGSTGQPKGVMCEHQNVVFASGSIIKYLQNTESDVVLGILPLSFDYGLYQMLMTFRFGGTLVLENSFAFPALVLERIAQERVTGLPGVPTLFTLLQGLEIEAYDLSSLRYITNTAAALPPTQVLELRRRFPHARLYSMYGLTETKRTLYLPPEELERRPGSVGIPIPGTEAWLEDETGQRLPSGEVGELVVLGPHVMRGYWEDAAATAHRFRMISSSASSQGRRVCCTGDLFRQDEEGFFYFIGRKDDIIKSRGEKVAPKEVEEVLHAIPGVAEAAVIGIPDPILGQAIKAYIVCRGEPLSTARVLAHCRTRLEDFMLPREVEFVEALPKNASGKIDKLSLAKRETVGHDSQSMPNSFSKSSRTGDAAATLDSPSAKPLEDGPARSRVGSSSGSFDESTKLVGVVESSLPVASYEKPRNS